MGFYRTAAADLLGATIVQRLIAATLFAVAIDELVTTPLSKLSTQSTVLHPTGFALCALCVAAILSYSLQFNHAQESGSCAPFAVIVWRPTFKGVADEDSASFGDLTSFESTFRPENVGHAAMETRSFEQGDNKAFYISW